MMDFSFICTDACDMLNRPRKHYQNMAMNEPNAIVNSLGTQNHVNSLYECNENFLNRLNGTNKFNFTLMARVRLKVTYSSSMKCRKHFHKLCHSSTINDIFVF